MTVCWQNGLAYFFYIFVVLIHSLWYFYDYARDPDCPIRWSSAQVVVWSSQSCCFSCLYFAEICLRNCNLFSDLLRDFFSSTVKVTRTKKKFNVLIFVNEAYFLWQVWCLNTLSQSNMILVALKPSAIWIRDLLQWTRISYTKVCSSHLSMNESKRHTTLAHSGYWVPESQCQPLRQLNSVQEPSIMWKTVSRVSLR